MQSIHNWKETWEEMNLVCKGPKAKLLLTLISKWEKLELCLESAARALQFLQWAMFPLFLQQEVHGYLDSVAWALQFIQQVGLPLFLQQEVQACLDPAARALQFINGWGF